MFGYKLPAFEMYWARINYVKRKLKTQQSKKKKKKIRNQRCIFGIPLVLAFISLRIPGGKIIFLDHIAKYTVNLGENLLWKLPPPQPATKETFILAES